MRAISICFAMGLLLACGCSGERYPNSLLAPNGDGTIVVDARLIVGQHIPEIVLRTTRSPGSIYSRYDAALLGAEVFITSSLGDTAYYMVYDRGIYVPYKGTGPSVTPIRPNTTYYLHVLAPDGRVVTAETTTPDSFHVSEWLLRDDVTLAVRRRLAVPSEFTVDDDSVFIVDSNQLTYQDGIVEARFDRGHAIAFQMALFNLESDSPLLFDADFLSEADKETLDRENASPPIDAPDGFARLPWLAVWYQGRHRFVVYSLDRNWDDLARSTRFEGPGNLGFGSNAGDDFERPLFHIEGGIGLFGSAAMDETGFTVWPRP